MKWIGGKPFSPPPVQLSLQLGISGPWLGGSCTDLLVMRLYYTCCCIHSREAQKEVGHAVPLKLWVPRTEGILAVPQCSASLGSAPPSPLLPPPSETSSEVQATDAPPHSALLSCTGLSPLPQLAKDFGSVFCPRPAPLPHVPAGFASQQPHTSLRDPPLWPHPGLVINVTLHLKSYSEIPSLTLTLTSCLVHTRSLTARRILSLVLSSLFSWLPFLSWLPSFPGLVHWDSGLYDPHQPPSCSDSRPLPISPAGKRHRPTLSTNPVFSCLLGARQTSLQGPHFSLMSRNSRTWWEESMSTIISVICCVNMLSFWRQDTQIFIFFAQIFRITKFIQCLLWNTKP